MTSLLRDELRERVHSSFPELHEPLAEPTPEIAARFETYAEVIQKLGGPLDRAIVAAVTALAKPDSDEALAMCRHVDDQLDGIGVGPRDEGDSFDLSRAPPPVVICPPIVEKVITDYPFHRAVVEARVGSDAGAQFYFGVYLRRVKTFPQCCDAHRDLRLRLMLHTASFMGGHQTALGRWAEAIDTFTVAAKAARKIGDAEQELHSLRGLSECHRNVGATTKHAELLRRAARLLLRLDAQRRHEHEEWLVPMQCAVEAFARRALDADLVSRAVNATSPGTFRHANAISLMAYTARTLGRPELVAELLASVPPTATSPALDKESAMYAFAESEPRVAVRHLSRLIDDAHGRIAAARDFSDMHAAVNSGAQFLLHQALATLATGRPTAALVDIEMVINAAQCKLLRSRRAHDGTWYFGEPGLSPTDRFLRMRKHAEETERAFLYFVLSPDGKDAVRCAVVWPRLSVQWLRLNTRVNEINGWLREWQLAEYATQSGNLAAVTDFKHVVGRTLARLEGLLAEDATVVAAHDTQPRATSLRHVLFGGGRRTVRPHGLVVLSHGSMAALPTQAISVTGRFNVSDDQPLYPSHGLSLWGHWLAGLGGSEDVNAMYRKATAAARRAKTQDRSKRRHVDLMTDLQRLQRNAFYDRGTQERGAAKNSHLAFGVPNIIANRGLAAADAEIEMIRAAWPSAVVYDATSCSRATIDDLVDASVFLHVIAHAHTPFHGGSGYLDLGGEQESRLDIARILARRAESLGLVVLSSCRAFATPSKDNLCADADLAHAFLAAGARIVMASMWTVADRASAAFMGLFWVALAFQRCVSCAASHARAAMRGSITWPDAVAWRFTIEERSEWRHPYYWAGFRLLGAA